MSFFLSHTNIPVLWKDEMIFDGAIAAEYALQNETCYVIPVYY
jgi:hypothetical protein